MYFITICITSVMQFIRGGCVALLLGLLLLPGTSKATPFRELLAKSQQDTSSQEDLASTEEVQSINDENLKDLQSVSEGTITPVTDAAAREEESNTGIPVSITQNGTGDDIPEVIVNLAPDTKPPNDVSQNRIKKSPYCVQVRFTK
jgi:hypothetical protein